MPNDLSPDPERSPATVYAAFEIGDATDEQIAELRVHLGSAIEAMGGQAVRVIVARPERPVPVEPLLTSVEELLEGCTPQNRAAASGSLRAQGLSTAKQILALGLDRLLRQHHVGPGVAAHIARNLAIHCPDTPFPEVQTVAGIAAFCNGPEEVPVHVLLDRATGYYFTDYLLLKGEENAGLLLTVADAVQRTDKFRLLMGHSKHVERISARGVVFVEEFLAAKALLES